MTSKNATTQDNGSLVELCNRLRAHECDDPSECSEHEAADELLRRDARIGELERALERINEYDRLAVGPALDIARAALAGGDKG